MDNAFSNLTSKHYCPKCGSFNLRRVHRGFIKKKLLKLAAQYECKSCSSVLSETTLDENEAQKVPQLIS
jgi:transposase-like protein